MTKRITKGNTGCCNGAASLVEEFRAYLTALNRSPSTIRGYIGSIEKFILYLDEANISSPCNVRWYEIEIYQNRLLSCPSYRVASVETLMSGVRALYRFLRSRGDIVVLPTDLVPLPKKPHRLPRNVLTEQEVEKLLAVPDTDTDKGIYWRAVLELAYSTGLRISEVCALKLNDVDTAGGTVRVVNGKGGKDRTTPLGGNAALWVRAYRDLVRPKVVHSQSEDNFFVGFLRGRAIHQDVVTDMFKACLRRAGITRKATFHGLRAACATHLIRNGADVMDVKSILGHELVSTTRKYVEVSANDLRAAHKQFHPRS